MLRKLLKHEFRATGRVMLPLFALLLFLSLFMGMGIRVFETLQSTFLKVLFILLFTAYGIAAAGVFIAVLVLMVSRFRKNYLGDEGYVMFTLPVDVHRLVWAKALVASVWFLAALVAAGLSTAIIGLICSIGTGFWQEFMKNLAWLWEQLTAYYAINGLAIFLEGILVTFAGYVCLCLMCYASLAIGHGFDRRKMLCSVGIFFGFYAALQLLSTLFFAYGGVDNYIEMLSRTDPMQAAHLVMLFVFVTQAVTGTIFYFLTTRNLRTRLNLE